MVVVINKFDCISKLPTGYFSEFNDNQYYISRQKYNSSIAQLAALCRDKFDGGTLIEIRTEAEYNFFINFLKQSVEDAGRDHVMLGASYNDSVWTYFSSRTGISYGNWYGSEETNSRPLQDCQYLVWNSNEEGMQAFVCETSGSDYTDTRLACQTHSGTSVVFDILRRFNTRVLFYLYCSPI